MTRGAGRSDEPERSRETTDAHTHLLRVTLAEPECHAYWENVDLAVPPALRATAAFEQRWFGAKSMARVQTLIAALAARFDAFPESLAVLRAWPDLRAPARVLVCHLHLQLTDPVYRAFTGDFLVKRRAAGHTTIGRDQVERWVHDTWGNRWAAATRLKFASNLLTAASEAGFLAGRRDPRPLTLPPISDAGLGYALYLLREAVPDAALFDNPYIESLGLTREALLDKLRGGVALRVRNLGDVVDVEWAAPNLRQWAEQARQGILA